MLFRLFYRGDDEAHDAQERDRGGPEQSSSRIRGRLRDERKANRSQQLVLRLRALRLGVLDLEVMLPELLEVLGAAAAVLEMSREAGAIGVRQPADQVFGQQLLGPGVFCVVHTGSP